MHYAKLASRSASLDDSSHEGPDKQPRVKPADLGFSVPEIVLNETIPISDPKLLYINIHTQRDRRLRLLIRRYTNQIQYGCRNINCTTPTCLSYKKRNSTAPLRKYTELSARTLACQLVEEFNRGGKEPVSGLCQNEPVVPWYEDPAITRKRRNSVEKAGNHRQENGHLPKSAGLAQRARDPSKHTPPVAEHAPRRPSQDGFVQVGRRLRAMDLSKDSDEVAEDIFEVLNSTLSRDGFDRPRLNETQAETTNVEVTEPPPEPARPKDLASFTQALFDLFPLRLLNWLPAMSRTPSSPRTTSTDDFEYQPQDLLGIRASGSGGLVEEPSCRCGHVPDGQERGSAKDEPQPIYTLRTLSWRTIPWLRAKHSEARDSETRGNRFLAFFRQSFTYCLSDPERLVRTVKDLQDTYGAPPAKKLPDGQNPTQNPNDERNSTIQVCHPHPWPIISTKTKAEMHALLFSLTFLEKFNERNLILGSIFTALQQLYCLPPWLQNRRLGKHNHSTSGCNESALIRRQFSGSSNTADSSLTDSMDLDILSANQEPLPALKETQITEVCLVALVAIASFVFDTGDTTWCQKANFSRFKNIRNSGLAHSRWPRILGREEPRHRALDFVRSMIEAIDVADDWDVLRTLSAIMDIISHRLTVAKWAATLKSADSKKAKPKDIVGLLVDRFDRNLLARWDSGDSNSSWIGTAVIELARTVMLKKWDRRPIVQRAGPVGGALELLAGIYRERKDLNLDVDLFHMPFIAETFDDMSMPTEWLSFRADTRQMHILSFSFLFEPATLVKYFRAINIDIMRKSHENATIVYNDTRQYMWAPAIPLYGAKEVLAHLRPHMAKYFVLTIRRDNLLNDAINQIWRRQRRELMRPLRVRLGKDEGEDGLDHGGVQQEFFRVVFAEALRPEYGMFTVDSMTRMTWFQPGSFEPLYRFEALGILMSLAVYNGITLPITFPLAFYRKVLGLKVKTLDHIADGWPDLTKGLKSLLEWSDGDVGDVIARTYEFSYDLCGSTVTVDMQKIGRDDPWPPAQVRLSKKGKEKSKSTSFELPIEPALTPPSQPSPAISPIPVPSLRRTSSVEIKGISTPQSIDSELLEASEEAALVTNGNREQYVKDYILWLTHKSVALQYEAFARGFYTCLDRTALSIFNPESLKNVIEGHTSIDIDELERTATYDEYTPKSPTIRDFWHIVRSMSPEQHRQLLEFVTASDRVPVNGLSSVQFIIQKNGEEDSRLPSSSTCYGRLLLPQYSSKEILEEKLTKAIENCVGFGTL